MAETVIEHDCRTPEQKRIAWKPRDYNPETDPYRNAPLPEGKTLMPGLHQVNSPAGSFISRQDFYGKNK